MLAVSTRPLASKDKSVYLFTACTLQAPFSHHSFILGNVHTCTLMHTKCTFKLDQLCSHECAFFSTCIQSKFDVHWLNSSQEVDEHLNRIVLLFTLYKRLRLLQDCWIVRWPQLACLVESMISLLSVLPLQQRWQESGCFLMVEKSGAAL